MAVLRWEGEYLERVTHVTVEDPVRQPLSQNSGVACDNKPLSRRMFGVKSQIRRSESRDLPTGFPIRSYPRGKLGQMARFYFHRQQDGKLVEDQKGRWFPNERAACRFALRKAAAAIGRVKDHAGTYVGIEVNDGSRTRCIVRAFITVEKPRR